MGLSILITGLIIFLGPHLFVTAGERRQNAIARLGVGYQIIFSVVSLIGLALIIWGFSLYRETGWIDLWTPPRAMRHITIALMLPAVILVFAAYLPGHIKWRAKHPMLAAIKLWALAHLLSNGDLGSILLFGSFLVWGIYARIAVKRRDRIAPPAERPTGWSNDALAVVTGVLIYLSLGYVFHPVVIGVPVFGV